MGLNPLRSHPLLFAHVSAKLGPQTIPDLTGSKMVLCACKILSVMKAETCVVTETCSMHWSIELWDQLVRNPMKKKGVSIHLLVSKAAPRCRPRMRDPWSFKLNATISPIPVVARCLALQLNTSTNQDLLTWSQAVKLP